MGLTGDSLATFYLLISLAAGAVIGAVSAPKGWRTNALAAIAVLLLVATVAWRWNPLAWPWIEPIIKSGGLIPLATITIVALIVGRRQPAPAVPSRATKPTKPKPLSAAAADDDALSNWKPDFMLFEAAVYVGDLSAWGKRRPPGSVKAQILHEMELKLSSGQVTAWARNHPETAEFQIRPTAWNNVTVDLPRNYAFSTYLSAPLYEIRLSQREVESVWPPAS